MKNHTRFRRLSEKECQKLHSASMEILERTGVRLHHQPAVDLLKKAGAAVSDGNRVRIPSALVERGLNSAPHEITLYNRYGDPVLPVGNFRKGEAFDCGTPLLRQLNHHIRRPNDILLLQYRDIPLFIGLVRCGCYNPVDR